MFSLKDFKRSQHECIVVLHRSLAIFVFRKRGPAHGKIRRYVIKIGFSMKFLNSTWNRLRYKIRLNSCKMSTQNEDLTSSFPISILHNNRKKIHFAQKIRIHAMLHKHNRNAFRENINTQRKLQHFFHTNGSQIHLESFDASAAAFISYLPNGLLIFFFERGFRNINASQLRI